MPKPCPRYRLFNQDCLETIANLPSKSVDTVICDPPYGLSFMGKQWDHGVPGMLFWARIRKVCKPGALLLAFGGTRTYHRLACAIEDGGWEIRDCMMWMYGSGFPKSLDISKAIDEAAGAEREVVGQSQGQGNIPNDRGKWGLESGKAVDITAAATPSAKQWKGYGTALKPAWEPIIVAMKPLRGTFAQNAIEHGVAGINVDAGRIGAEPIQIHGYKGDSYSQSYKQKGTRPELDEYRVASGRWPANLILSHHPECVQVGVKKVKGITGGTGHHKNSVYGKLSYDEGQPIQDYADADGLETVEAWDCHPDCPIKILDEQSGVGTSNVRPPTPDRPNDDRGTYQLAQRKVAVERGYSDSGGASRFFYTAKVSRRERNYGLPESMTNDHPTIKPLAIIEYLCKLTRSPSGGVVFDPFMGSGTTGVACAKTKRKFIGCEIDEEHGYFGIAQRRIRQAYKST